MNKKPHFVTVDFESDWGGRVSRCRAVELMTGPVLDALAAHRAKATFFVSTGTIDKTERWVRMIARAGHEIGSHGHDHALDYGRLSRSELLEQVRRSKAILEDLTGSPVLGFRTPCFRKNACTEEVLLEAGYRYDSSSVRTSLPQRYKARQHEFGGIPEFAVSPLFNRLPAGVKWMNFTRGRPGGPPPVIVYVHLFDLVGVRDMLRLYEAGISKLAVAFYFARCGSVFKTLCGLLPSSRPLSDLLVSEGGTADRPGKGRS